jgi:prophage tail gpP-like protein
MSKLTLHINKKEVPFTQANLTFSIEQLAHSFTATIPSVNINSPLPIQFKLDGEIIFSGQIDGAGDDTNGTSEQTSISGRSLSANLIDSRIKLDAIYNQQFDQLLKLIVSDFGLSVRNEAGELPEIPEFQINAESPLDNLAQVAKQQNLMLIEDNGYIVIQRPGQNYEQNTVLEVGANIESLNVTRNFKDQFYRYEIQGAWDDAFAVVNDESVNKSRIKVIIADKLQDEASCQTRAQYEKNIAIAKGLYATTTLPGLHAALTGAAINKTITAKNPKKEFNEILLIKTISISVNDKSENTSVELFKSMEE